MVKLYIKKIFKHVLLWTICFIIINFTSFDSIITHAQPTSEQTNEIIILFEDDTLASEREQVLKSFEDDIVVMEQFENYTLCQAAHENHIDIVLNALMKHPKIAAAELNSELELMGFTNDPYSDTQWALENNGHYTHIIGTTLGITTSTLGIDLNISTAWELYSATASPNKEVVIAIIDTGVDTAHPDLVNRIWKNTKELPGDGIDNDGNGYIDDTEGWDFYNNDNTVCHYEYNTHLKMEVAYSLDNDDHGTHCAGIIAANANNKIGIAGVASNINVKIMPLKIHGGLNGKGTVANAIKAIKYATMMGADICNMSWGSTNYSAALETAMRESTMLFITAAGNEGTNNDIIPLYPASFQLKNMLSVSFIDANGYLTRDSNYGSNSVDIAAPGADIFSTIVGTYSSMSGSSMAAPHVSAIAAMLYSTSNNLYAENIKEIILSNLKPLSSLNNYIRYPGIPDAGAIISSIHALRTDTIPPSLQLSTSYNKDKIIVDIIADDYESSGVRTIKYAIGNRTTSYFKHGTNGLTITDNSLSLAKSGVYTFYTSDYAGNAVSIPYAVSDDLEPPTLLASYKVSNDYKKITIYADIFDNLSGVKTVKYAAGVKTIDDFKQSSFGTKLKHSGDSVSFVVTQPGRYTIYAQDYRGNKSVLVINAKIVKSTSLALNRETKVLGVGKYFRLWPALLPNNSTDKVTYESSNPKVVSVNKWGLLNGISPGTATITATTSSGVKHTCIVIVKYPKN